MLLQFLSNLIRFVQCGHIPNCQLFQLSQILQRTQARRSYVAFGNLDNLQCVLAVNQLCQGIIGDVPAVVEHDPVYLFTAFQMHEAVRADAGISGFDFLYLELDVLWRQDIVITKQLWIADEAGTSTISQEPFGRRPLMRKIYVLNASK